ncbi:hypothetical protein [Streptosporangium canum]|uniref:hypothetical protein n=1 Tax=Streptosporangium canum TaxID=324952 RepID=UPI00379F9E55
MSRKKTSTTVDAPAGGSTTHHNMFKHLGNKALATVAPHTVPWMLGAGALPVGAVTHTMWGGTEALPWASAGLALSGAALSAVTWAVSRYRHPLGRLQSTGTTVVASGWLLAATITGPTARPTIDIGMWLGGTLAAGWNVRNIIRPFEAATEREAALTGPSLFKKLLTGTAEAAGMDVGVSNIQAAPHKIAGSVDLSEGDTVEDLQKAIPAMEAAARLPLGSLVVTPNQQNAGAPTVTMSNPMLLEESIPWFGPSRPGESVAKPLRVGLFQDGEMTEVVIVGSHVQIMGMTGAAKTTAGAWGIWGELITRKDTALIVLDITKGEQSVGPVRPAAHRVVTTKTGAKQFFSELQGILRDRLDYLADKNLMAWEEGCGLSYLVVWLEEAADLFDVIDMTQFVSLTRMLRSAGGTLIWSLQRGDSTQVPTFVKGQAGGFACFGVANSHDASWGLSDAQDDAGAAPERWRATKPGMAYLEMPGVPVDKIAMPMRFCDWGSSNEARMRNFRKHCEQWPAAARSVDPITARICPNPGALANQEVPATQTAPEDDDDVKNVAAEYLAPDPEMDDGVTPNLDEPLEEAEPVEFSTPTKATPEQARAVLDQVLAEFGDGREFAPRDLGQVLTRTGMRRGWIQKQLKARVDAGALEHDAEAGVYRVRALANA